MQTLQEFIEFTKGWEYVISIAFLALFIFFWRVFSTEPQARRTVPVGKTAPATAGGRHMSVAGASAYLQNSRCWEVKGCRVESRANCPAYRNPDVPCWQAKGAASTGVGLSSDCMGCHLFTARAWVAA
ncbi:MAG: hypothetical protein HW414_1539 [Dehalococcoidia bacterium]|nr:hypothetical protein [Dehalococcoidia bacterium]